ncbi:uncharacterized protein LOC143559239 [Bidens hawaiensis]|uniref:uncharacterized protein LOC143559239 n=1 Tax=Bidens hawaiensis TaxID=980011 RepID=UPI004049F403
MANRKKPPPLSPPPSSGRTNLASCIVATTFLTFITIILLIIFFTLLNPHNPTITITAVQLPSFTINTTVTFTISHYITVTNPNHGKFTHYSSSLQLLYAGNQMGFMFVPSGEIEARRTEYMAATFSVEGFPVVVVGPSLEVEVRMEMVGRVKVMRLFTNHVDVRVECRVAIDVNDGSVLGFRC